MTTKITRRRVVTGMAAAAVGAEVDLGWERRGLGPLSPSMHGVKGRAKHGGASASAGRLQKLCPPNTDVTISAIYRCHWHRGLGRAAGGREAPGVAQRPTDARDADGSKPHPLV